MRASTMSWRSGDELEGAVQREAGGEEPLEDGVLEVPGDALLILEPEELLVACRLRS